MKTIFDKIPLKISAGQTVTLQLPEAFCIRDSLFLLVHNAPDEILKVTISDAKGHFLTNQVSLNSFPRIIVFPECEGENELLNALEYFSVSFTSFHDFEGSLTFRVKNPAQVIAAYQGS